MSPVNFPVSNAPSNSPYVGGAENAGAPKKNDGVSPDTVMPESTAGKDDVKDRGFVPDAPKANTDMAPLRGMLCATLSPGAMMAALCIQEAAKMNEQNTADLMARNELVQQHMEEQAKKIEEAAMEKMILTIAGACMSIIGSVAGAGYSVGHGDSNVTKAVSDAIANCGASVGKCFEAGGGYVESMAQAANKRLDASIEQHRTMMEAYRNSMTAQRDLISKSLDFMNSMQSNMNQTMSRIMG